MPSRPSLVRPRCLDRPVEHGAGLLSSLVGLLVVLVLLLFAVEALVGLYARSLVTAVAHDAARQVASDARVRQGRGEAQTEGAVAEADANLRDLLGGAGRQTRTSWDVQSDEVVLVVRTERPRILPAPWRGVDPPTIERTVRVRLEELR